MRQRRDKQKIEENERRNETNRKLKKMRGETKRGKMRQTKTEEKKGKFNQKEKQKKSQRKLNDQS